MNANTKDDIALRIMIKTNWKEHLESGVYTGLNTKEELKKVEEELRKLETQLVVK